MIDITSLCQPITVGRLLSFNACEAGWEDLRDGMAWPKTRLVDADPNLTFTIRDVLDRGGGIEDALWALRCFGKEAEPAARVLNARVAAAVLHISKDRRCDEAVMTAALHAVGLASEDDLAAARAAAMTANLAAAWDAAKAAALVAASAAARAAALAAALAAAEAAADQDLRDLLDGKVTDTLGWVKEARQGPWLCEWPEVPQ